MENVHNHHTYKSHVLRAANLIKTKRDSEPSINLAFQP